MLLNMKSSTCTFLLVILMLPAVAQNKPSAPPVQKLVKLGLGLDGIGFSYEPRLGKQSTLEFTASFGGGYEIARNNLTYNVTSGAVAFTVTPKFYYNRERRAARGKTTALNAGDYIGLRVKYNTQSLFEGNQHDALLLNVHWGLQRPIGQRWLFNTHAGIGYALDASDLSNTEGTIYPALGFTFSYQLNR
jgi:hypothetical protein